MMPQIHPDNPNLYWDYRRGPYGSWQELNEGAATKPKPKPVVKPPITRIPPPETIPGPGGGGGGTGGPYPGSTVAGGGGWLDNPGGIGGILQGGLDASHKALPGLLNQPVTPGLNGASPYYGGAPWGMDPLDLRTLIMSQLQRALRQTPGKTML